MEIKTTDGRTVILYTEDLDKLRECYRHDDRNTTEIVLDNGTRYEFEGKYNFCRSEHGTPYLLTDKELEARDKFAVIFLGGMIIFIIVVVAYTIVNIVLSWLF